MIDNLNELIEKKIAIRDGALNDLMSGNTRLSGFKDKWVTIPFSRFFTVQKNNTYARDKLTNHGTVGNIHYGDVLVKYGDIVGEKDGIPYLKDGVSYSASWLLQENDIVIADTAEDETVGKSIQIGKISYQDKKYQEKVECYAGDNILAQALNPTAYHNNPQFLPLVSQYGFEAIPRFNKDNSKAVPAGEGSGC